MKTLIDDHCTQCGQITKDCTVCDGRGWRHSVGYLSSDPETGEVSREQEAETCGECNGTGRACPGGCQ